jgi:hypothetical protein
MVASDCTIRQNGGSLRSGFITNKLWLWTKAGQIICEKRTKTDKFFGEPARFWGANRAFGMAGNKVLGCEMQLAQKLLELLEMPFRPSTWIK